jgi:hypothetical protein
MPFYKTTFTITVLSEESIQNMDLADLAYAIDQGPCVGSFPQAEQVELTGKEMADALRALGSEPGFFNLDDAGEPTS